MGRAGSRIRNPGPSSVHQLSFVTTIRSISLGRFSFFYPMMTLSTPLSNLNFFMTVKMIDLLHERNSNLLISSFVNDKYGWGLGVDKIMQKVEKF